MISRIEFDKFFLILDNKEKEDIRTMCQSMERRLVEMQIEDFGMYDFYLYFGVYEKHLLMIQKLFIFPLLLFLFPN